MGRGPEAGPVPLELRPSGMSNTEPYPFCHSGRSRGTARRVRGASFGPIAPAQKLQGDRPRNTKYPRLRASGGARSLHFGRDDGKGVSTRYYYLRNKTLV